ncbi:MAG: tRNA uridine-5-carboxymethylaminomethyl(34) synthesis GTPase MnmE [Gammaproteobacteria bacterium]|nr:tRNA uridine-5-carboxymethylaminomethyl(34) synthesis GTPase MnmE [Gammaproteobacteria bacterium]
MSPRKSKQGDRLLGCHETIAAVATPPGRGGVGIVRVSGPATAAISEQVLGRQLSPRRAEYLPFKDSDGLAIDQGIALFFPNPHSFTGEDVLELQGHGGPVVMDMLLERVVQLGARIARPGEFSEQAFLNDKLDLTQAEAIADLIDSASQQAARMALRSLQGAFSDQINQLVERFINLRVYVESAIDFPEEEIDFLTEGNVAAQVAELKASLQQVIDSAHQGQLLREGATIVIAGQPNVGKSTLLNRLTGRDSAIVTNTPGTTRDLLREQILIDGLPLHIIDTAGLRETSDQVEKIGIQRARDEISKADRLLLIVDGAEGISAEDQSIIDQLSEPSPPMTLIRNKIDNHSQHAAFDEEAAIPTISLSAKRGEGVELLRQHLKACVGYQSGAEGGFMARHRHLDALNRAMQHISQGEAQLLGMGAGELLAEELRQAQGALNEITGEFGSDELLGKIFSSFCIGK